MSGVSKSFSAVGNGPELQVPHLESYLYDVSGTFVGTVKLEEYVSGGWRVVATLTGAGTATVQLEAGNKRYGRVRFRCSAYTSGSIVTTIDPVRTQLDYGLDLKAAANYAGTPSILKAQIRGSDGDWVVMTGAGAPVDGTTGDNFAGIGSLYLDLTNGNAYLQTAVITAPVWKLITRAA